MRVRKIHLCLLYRDTDEREQQNALPTGQKDYSLYLRTSPASRTPVLLMSKTCKREGPQERSGQQSRDPGALSPAFF